MFSKEPTKNLLPFALPKDTPNPSFGPTAHRDLIAQLIKIKINEGNASAQKGNQEDP